MRFGLMSVGILGLAVTLLTGCAMAGDEHKSDEKKIALGEAPAAVQAAVKKVAGDQKLDKLVKETDEGKTVYEAEFKVNGAAHSAKISETGEVLEEEMDVQAAELPQPVRDAVSKKFPDGKITRAEMARANGKAMYEIHVQSGKDTHELVVNAAGQVQEEKKSDEDDKDEKDEKDEKDKD
ncbi:hypothetical protein BH09PLA1_BH09PLA1_24010 [soil metagenome]